MSKFIKLTADDGSRAVFNASFFIVVYKHGKLTRIVFDGKGENSELVKETPEQILTLINGEDQEPTVSSELAEEPILYKKKVFEIGNVLNQRSFNIANDYQTLSRIGEIVNRKGNE